MAAQAAHFLVPASRMSTGRGTLPSYVGLCRCNLFKRAFSKVGAIEGTCGMMSWLVSHTIHLMKCPVFGATLIFAKRACIFRRSRSILVSPLEPLICALETARADAIARFHRAQPGCAWGGYLDITSFVQW